MASSAGHAGLASSGWGRGRRHRAWAMRGGLAAARDGDNGTGCRAASGPSWRRG
jgi:hypothetical protein